MEWIIVAAFAILGAVWRRWFGFGGSGPRWVKLLALALLIGGALWGAYWGFYIAFFAVFYFIPGHHFAGREAYLDLWLRYAAPPVAIWGILAALVRYFEQGWHYPSPALAVSGVGVAVGYSVMNYVYLETDIDLAFNKWFDGPFAIAEHIAGFWFIGCLAVAGWVAL